MAPPTGIDDLNPTRIDDSSLFACNDLHAHAHALFGATCFQYRRVLVLRQLTRPNSPHSSRSTAMLFRGRSDRSSTFSNNFLLPCARVRTMRTIFCHGATVTTNCRLHAAPWGYGAFRDLLQPIPCYISCDRNSFLNAIGLLAYMFMSPTAIWT